MRIPHSSGLYLLQRKTVFTGEHCLVSKIINCCSFVLGRDSSVDSLRAGRSGDRIPVGARFSAPVRTGPGVHPASCTMGTGSFMELKQPGRGVDHPPLSSAKVKERVELYLYSPSGASWPVLGRTVPLPLPFWRAGGLTPTEDDQTPAALPLPKWTELYRDV
jgi:hypothetical protein